MRAYEKLITQRLSVAEARGFLKLNARHANFEESLQSEQQLHKFHEADLRQTQKHETTCM